VCVCVCVWVRLGLSEISDVKIMSLWYTQLIMIHLTCVCVCVWVRLGLSEISDVKIMSLWYTQLIMIHLSCVCVCEWDLVCLRFLMWKSCHYDIHSWLWYTWRACVCEWDLVCLRSLMWKSCHYDIHSWLWYTWRVCVCVSETWSVWSADASSSHSICQAWCAAAQRKELAPDDPALHELVSVSAPSSASASSIIIIVIITARSSYASAVLEIVILYFRLSVTRVLCDEMKEHTAVHLTPHERVFNLVFWYQQSSVGYVLFHLKFALKLIRLWKTPTSTNIWL